MKKAPLAILLACGLAHAPMASADVVINFEDTALGNAGGTTGGVRYNRDVQPDRR